MAPRTSATPHADVGHPHTRGVVLVHSAPAALCPHVGWALEGILEHQVRLDWTAQPATPRLMRAELAWTGPVGTGDRLASALRGWDHMRYEVTEEPTTGHDGSRWSHTPSLGLHRSTVSASGDVLVGEERLRGAVHRAQGDLAALQSELDDALGGPWDRELEPFRYAGDGAPVRWLHKVG